MSEFAGKVVVVTGGARGIGRCIAEKFREAGAAVCVFDLLENPYFVGNLASEPDLRVFCDKVLAEYGQVDFLVNNAAPLFKGLPDCSWDEFNYALQVGVTAPYMLTRLLLGHFAEGAAVVNISSSRDRMSMPGTECYTAAKGGDCGAYACTGCVAGGAGAGEFHFAGVD
ncbi:MAG: SDR family NAD(P)-dependent oxidoreductase [Akkermansia sp.]|nr:SDR family NAD(P)-dependent oxidoreductase [Akkermansia sp.]